MTKGIRIKEFNRFFKGGTAFFRRFHGAKARHVKNYVSTHLEEEQPDTVIIHAGGNDLPTRKNNPTPVLEIANHIIEAGQICASYDVDNIYISSVINRKTRTC